MAPRNEMEMALSDKLRARWVGRAIQIEKLLLLFGPADTPVPPIFISGHSSTGKTSVIRDIMESLKVPHAYVSCVECCSQRMIFDMILNQLYGHQPCAANDFSNFAKCSDLPTFIQLLQGLRKRNRIAGDPAYSSSDDTHYIILDNAERLRNYEPTFFAALLRLDELSGINICVVMITAVNREHFEHNLCNRPVLRVHFQDYTQQETYEILSRENFYHLHQNNVGRDDEGVEILYRQFLKMLLDVFWRHCCRNLEELRQMRTMLFPKFIAPVLDGTVDASDHAKLFRLLRPWLRQASTKLFVRNFDDEALRGRALFSDAAAGGAGAHGGATECAGRRVNCEQRGVLDIELPVAGKVLLVAGYLASHCPPARDVATFSLRHGGPVRRKKKGGYRVTPCGGGGGPNKGEEDLDPRLRAPRPFGLERLLALYYSVGLDEEARPTATLLSQIGGLVSLGVLSAVGGDTVWGPKYRCEAPYALVRAVADTLRFDLDGYIAS